MNFTLWQIDKLRRGLHAYRVLKAANGQLRPWKKVIDDLISSPATKREYSEFLSVSDFKEEALRRFAEGENLLLPDKLDDVASFLISVRVVSADEMKEGADIVADNLLLYRSLANHRESASQRLARLLTDYRATRRARGHTEEIDLRLAPQPLSGFVLAEELVRVTALEGVASRYDRKDDNIVGVSVRKGCALVASHHPTLHIFARGGTSDDFIHYVDVSGEGKQEMDPLLLVRSGAEAPAIDGRAQGDDLLSRYNIVRFTPTTSRPVLQAVRPPKPKSTTRKRYGKKVER